MPQQGKAKTVQQEQFKVNQPGGFHVNERDTTAVLSPISGRVEETETSSQPAPALSLDGKSRAQTAPATEKSAPAGWRKISA